ncbi:MGDG synthase family glycosyltransferase [Holdemania filiformis]|jgi:processive 1,2-diacylglycerol beta-glucosyltransferase|uniref:MGDG synthase family glycosyltransferase n=1 Tax=Holdemania filiformis TaxID=61171 RepID=UPI002676F168|nr:glycosyltransferase [Holdemania filiformis]
MNVLIFSVTAGYGHIAAAQAVSLALTARGAHVVTVDLYEHVSPTVQRMIGSGYTLASKYTPRIYRTCYRQAEIHGRQTFLFALINRINVRGLENIRHLIAETSPDLIVCTHIFAAQLIDLLKQRGMLAIPAIGIVTDYTLHPFWETVPAIEHLVIASELLAHAALKRGLDAERLLPFGIPIHPKFKQAVSREDATAQLGLDPAKPTILLMGGSMGYSNSQKIIVQLAKTGLPLQILAVCGRNQKQFQRLTQMKPSLNGICQLFVYGFAENVEILMSAADCLITKPGGLTVSEALAKKLPMFLTDPIPGHEERNAEFLVNNGVSLRLTKTFGADEAVYQFFHNFGRAQALPAMMQSLSPYNAADQLADFIMNTVNGKTEVRFQSKTDPNKILDINE